MGCRVIDCGCIGRDRVGDGSVSMMDFCVYVIGIDVLGILLFFLNIFYILMAFILYNVNFVILTVVIIEDAILNICMSIGPFYYAYFV